MKVLITLTEIAIFCTLATCDTLNRAPQREKARSQVRNADPLPSVTIDSGVIVGKVATVPDSGVPVHQFLGIPFAEPPVGDLRFAPPQKKNAWTQPLNTNSFAASCYQDFGSTPQERAFNMTLFDTPPPVPNVESEDCLYVNVFVPKGGCANSKPVLFWIYGGAYSIGTSSLPIYDGTTFAAKQDVIVVTFNYRINLFGYPRSPQLPLTEQNLGHLDQRLALEWVKCNIRAFGGNPDKITLAGESAGAESVDDLITTTPTDPPFRAAILESGQDSFGTPPQLPNNDTTAWKELMKAVGCTSGTDADILSCARSISATTLKTTIESKALSFNSPVSDNITRLENPALAHALGKVAKVPTFLGSNYNDGSAFVVGAGDNVTEFLLSLKLPSTASEVILKTYAPGSPIVQGLTTGHEIISKIITDYTFFCPPILYSNLSTTVTKAPSWLYLFNATFANTQPQGYPGLGVYHSSEISLVFGTYPKINSTAEEQSLSSYMQKAWANFVKDPYHNGPGWAPYPAIEILGSQTGGALSQSKSVSDLDQACETWDLLYAASLKQ